jgi:hypothetical protein
MPKPHNAVAINATTYYHLRRYAVSELPNSYCINLSGIPVLYVHDRGMYYACILWPIHGDAP